MEKIGGSTVLGRRRNAWGWKKEEVGHRGQSNTGGDLEKKQTDEE